MNDSRIRRDAGFTLVELMTAVALTAVVTGSMIGLGDRAADAATDVTARGDDLDGFRDAMQRIAADLRAARAVDAATDDRVRIAFADGGRTWTVSDGLLAASDATGTRVVAHDVRALDVTRDGPLWRFALVVGRGSRIATAVLPRTEATR